MPHVETPPLGYALKQAQHALHRRMEQALTPLGLTPAQYAALLELRARPDQTNARLADIAFLTPQSMQGVLARLEVAGHVIRRPDHTHGRRQLARLTDEGRRTLAAAEGVVGPIEAALADALSPLTPAEARALLERLRSAMAPPSDTAGA